MRKMKSWKLGSRIFRIFAWLLPYSPLRVFFHKLCGVRIGRGAYVGKGIRVPSDRYVAPGCNVLNQEQADALPPVPDNLINLRRSVLEMNKDHVARHLASERILKLTEGC